MEELALKCFQIITAVGNARSCYIEAIQEAKKCNFDGAWELIREGEKSFIEGHHAHVALIQKEAAGERSEINLLLIHAEDQLMSAETFRIIAEELIAVHEKINEVK